MRFKNILSYACVIVLCASKESATIFYARLLGQEDRKLGSEQRDKYDDRMKGRLGIET